MPRVRSPLILVVVAAAGCQFVPDGSLGVTGGAVDAGDLTADDALAVTDDATTDDAAPAAPDGAVDARPVDAGLPIDAPPPTDPTEDCGNGGDDDGDGDPDCRDDDCPACDGLLSCCASGACAVLCL